MSFSQGNIVHSCDALKTTVKRVVKKANELGIASPLQENQTNAVLAKLFTTPSAKPEDVSTKPDSSYIREKLMRNGVTKNFYNLGVVGGVSFSGGVGTIPGVIIGSIILQFLNYGLNYIGINVYLQTIIKGIIIITAVAIDVRKYIAKK